MTWNTTQDRICGFFIESCLIILILFSPLIYGSVTIFPLSIIETISFFLFFIFISRFLLKKESFLIKIPFLGLILFVSLIIAQLIPLSAGLLSFLSPATLDIYKEFRATNTGDFTLSIYPDSTFNILLQIFSFLAVFFVVLNYIDSEKKITRLIFIIVISGVAYSLYGIAQRLYMDNAGFSTFTNRNHFSAYVQMIIPLGIGYSLTRISKSLRIIFIFFATVMILALFLSLSRAGRICFSLNIIFFFILLKIKRPTRKALSVIMILVLLLSVFIWFIGWAPLLKRLETLSSPFKAYSDRFYAAVDSLKIVKDFPLFGTGLGTFGEIFQKYKTLKDQYTWSFCHNEPVQLLVEMGILGFLLILFFLVRYFSQIFSVWLKRNAAIPVYITLGCFVGIFSIISHSLFDFVFHIPANTLLFFIILALAYRSVYMKSEQSLSYVPNLKINLAKHSKFALILIFFLSLIFIESLIWKHYQAEAIFERIKDKKINNYSIEAIFEYKKALRDIDKAIGLDSMNSLYLNKKADLLSEMALRNDIKDELLMLEDFKDTSSLLATAESHYKKAINLNPTKADYHLRLGWLYSVLGFKKLAQKELKNSLLLDPQNAKIKSYVEGYLYPPIK